MITLCTITIRAETPESLNPARELIHNPLGPGFRNVVAFRIGDGTGIFVASKAFGGGLTALEGPWAGALV
jgi:hypothetical protein|tara:strand:- start:65846 stop:66055 length:210 start_codon:yes stop_codon:yes gene_type:complete